MGVLEFLGIAPAKDGLLQRQEEKALVVRQVAEMVNTFNRNLYRWFNDDQPIFVEDNNYQTYIKEGYQNIGVVYECVSLLLNKLAACPILVYEVKDEQGLKQYNNLLRSNVLENKARAIMMKSRVLEEVSVKEIQDIIDRPNSYQNINDITEYLAGAHLLTGNHYILREGPLATSALYNPKTTRFTEIHALPPQETSIVSGGWGEPIKGYKFSYTDEVIPAFKVIHGKAYNPDYSVTGSQLYGQAPLRAYLRDLTILKEGDKEIAKQLKNGGTFGIVTPKNKEDQWSRDQAQQFKDRLTEAKANPDEVSRIFPGAVPLEWLQIGLTMADMQLTSLVGIKKEDIYRAFHIPLQYLNQEGSSYNNKSEAGKELIYNALDPVAQKIAFTYTKAICDPIYNRTGKRYIIKIDTSSLPEMAADMKEIAEWLSRSPELTLNEKREVKGWGRLEGIENMDIPLVPNSLVRVDMVGIDTNAFNRANEETDNIQA